MSQLTPPPKPATGRSSRTQAYAAVTVVLVILVGLGLYEHHRHSSSDSLANHLQQLPHTTTTDADGGTTETFQLGPPGKAGDDLGDDMFSLGRAEYDYEYQYGQYTSSLADLEQAGYQQLASTPVEIWLGTTTAGQKGYCIVGSAGDLSQWLVNGQTSTGVSVVDGATSEVAGEQACEDSTITNFARII